MKIECRRIDAFDLWCRRRLSRVPWTARRSNQLIIKEIKPEYSLEGLILKLQYFGHLMRRADSLEMMLFRDAGKDWGQEGKGETRWDGWMASLTQWTWVWANSGRQWRTGKPGVLQSMRLQRAGHDLVTEQQRMLRTAYSQLCTQSISFNSIQMICSIQIATNAVA